MSTEKEVNVLIQGVYDQINALNPGQQRLLISDALHIAHNGLEKVDGADEGQVAILQGIVALAGYTSSVLSDAENDTATGDKAVDDVLNAYRDVVTATAALDLAPEDQKTAHAMVARVKERVEKGEDFDTAMADEAHKLGDGWSDAIPHGTDDTGEGDGHGGYGLYL